MRVLLLGDQAESGKWLSVGKRLARHLLEAGGGTRTIYPASGVTIKVQVVDDNPKVWITAGGVLYVTAGFNSDGILEVRGSRLAFGPFNRITTFADYTTDEYHAVVHLNSPGDGKFSFLITNNTFDVHSDSAKILLFENASSVVLTGTIDITSAHYLDPTPPYVIIPVNGGHHILSVDNIAYGEQPVLRWHDWKGNLVLEMTLPFSAGGRELVEVYGLYKMPNNVVLLRGIAASASPGVEAFPFLLRSTDNGTSWGFVSSSEYPFAPHGSEALYFGFTPLANDAVLGSGLIDKDPTGENGIPNNQRIRFASTLSEDNGVSFGDYTDLGSSFTYLEADPQRPVAIGALGALQAGILFDEDAFGGVGDLFFLITTDGGSTWGAVDAPTFEDAITFEEEPVGSMGKPLVVSINSEGAATLVMTAVPSGDAQTAALLYRSIDSGATWENIGVVTKTGAPDTLGFGLIVACGSLSGKKIPDPVVPNLYVEAQ